jgi:hypothetical protein
MLHWNPLGVAHLCLKSIYFATGLILMDLNFNYLIDTSGYVMNNLMTPVVNAGKLSDNSILELLSLLLALEQRNRATR